MEENVDWAKVQPEVTDFIFAQAERYLDSQLQIGLAADSRAITASSILVGVAAAALTGAAGLFLTNQPAAAYTAAFVLGAGMSVAAYLCYRAASPIEFYPPGNHPRQWYGSVGEPLAESKGVEAQNYQEMIDANTTAIQGAAEHLKNGVLVAIASPAAALMTFAIATFSS